MADYNDQQNYNRDRDHMNASGQGHNGRVPEYNFWAEQMTSRPYSNYNPNTNTWEYSHSATRAEESGASSQSKGRRVLQFILKALCFGIIAAISFYGFQRLYFTINPNAAGRNIQDSRPNFDLLKGKSYEIKQTKPGTVQTQLRTAVSEVIDDTMPSIVSIRSISTETSIWFGQKFNQEAESSGSGIIVGKNENELLIATNNHVVSGANKIIVTYIDGSETEAIIKGADAVADLAVITVDMVDLTVDTIEAIEIAKLGNSDEIKVGEMVIAIGNALGYGQSVTVGYVSAKDREVQVSDGFNTKTMVLLQTDAAINPGNSGGALLNIHGEVIGINTVKYASDRVEGMGYAIPISRAVPVINELMSREILKPSEQGYLGIGGNDVTEDVSEALNMPIGVFVNVVMEDSAAEKAGILPGDIIIGADEIEITAITQLSDYIKSRKVGTEVKITYMRRESGTYEEHTVKVTLGANPDLQKEAE
ncbi:MAG: PDZ domain-containing protein [Clostridiales bacterium]|nr:PDZ domain-containing protein [Clostridiales bacterium]